MHANVPPLIFFPLFFCMMFACTTTLESVHRCRKPPLPPYEEVRARTKEAVLAASEGVYQPAPSVCCCSLL